MIKEVLKIKKIKNLYSFEKKTLVIEAGVYCLK